MTCWSKLKLYLISPSFDTKNTKTKVRKCWRSVNRDDATSVGWKCFSRLFELEEGVPRVFMKELGSVKPFYVR